MTSSARVDPTFSEAKGRERILQYLTDTLRELPAQLSLSWQHPRYSHAIFGDAHTVPCIDDDTVPNPPLNVGADYWVVGVPDGQTRQYFQTVLDVWKKFGWQTVIDDTAAPQTYGRARTHDDFAINVVDNGKGDLAITISSPCFPHENTGGQPLPKSIQHP
ncbi:hypothetical protein [Nocardia wallacei]|uniref:hypothetical protein n=1 Tax=Nocardia wallacei TaxID=480035 RepID=UPI00245622A9|nr:hypothetical protein [Nocardia wallacei]